MITGFCTCSGKGAYQAYALSSVLSRLRPRVCTRIGCWRPHTNRALTSVHIVDVGSHMLSLPSCSSLHSRSIQAPFAACARTSLHSRLHPCLFPHAPTVVFLYAHTTRMDRHLKLPATTSFDYNKENYCSKVNY